MVIREYLSNDEYFVNNEGDLADDYIKIFVGNQAGIALTKRAVNDPHVCFMMLGEDDNAWFPMTGTSSSFWLPEYIEVLQYAQDWLDKNAEKKKWGWNFWRHTLDKHKLK